MPFLGFLPLGPSQHDAEGVEVTRSLKLYEEADNTEEGIGARGANPVFPFPGVHDP